MATDYKAMMDDVRKKNTASRPSSSADLLAQRDAAIEALREAMGTIAGIFAPSKLPTQWQRWVEIVNRKGSGK